MKAVVLTLVLLVLSGPVFSGPEPSVIVQCDTDEEFLAVRKIIKTEMDRYLESHPNENHSEEFQNFLLQNLTYVSCQLIDWSTDQFTISSENYPTIVEHYSDLGFNIRNSNRVLIYPFASFPTFFDPTKVQFPKAVFFHGVAESYLGYAANDMMMFEIFSDDFPNYFSDSTSNVTKKFATAVSLAATEKIFNANSVILIDDYFWNLASTTETEKEIILVHELRHQLDFTNDRKEYLNNLKSYLTASVSSSPTEQMTKVINTTTRETLLSAGLEVPARYKLPDEERYLEILLQLDGELDFYQQDPYEIRASIEESLYLMRKGFNCDQVAKFKTRIARSTINRTALGEFYVAPVSKNLTFKIKNECENLISKT